MNFFERLKEERNRLGLNQTDFGDACGVRKQAQIRYEKGERKPDSDYLQKASDIGVDVGYLLTGVRSEVLKDKAMMRSYRINGVEQDIVSVRMNSMINEPKFREGLETMTDDEVGVVMRLVKSYASDK